MSFFLLQKNLTFPGKLKTMTEASASLCLILATALKINVNKIVLEWPDLTEKNYEYSIGKMRFENPEN